MMDVGYALEKSLLLIQEYSWLIDAYVLDFYTDRHWEKLPKSWKTVFDKIEPNELSQLIEGGSTSVVFPLSFLALIKSVEYLCVNRKVDCGKISNIGENIYNSTETDARELSGCIHTCGTHPNLKQLFLKHVKLKKRHEINHMCQLVEKIASKSSCDAVIDFGSGLGHMVRTLGYKCNLRTLGLEANRVLVAQARKLDDELEYTASKYLHESVVQGLKRPNHFVKLISSQTDFDILNKEAVCIIGDQFGLVGLHPCGDLGPLLLKYFVTFSHVKFICMVSCCYMKLTCDSKSAVGYPLSSFVSSLKYHKLSYESREIACHAQEMYCQRLNQGLYDDLKVHSYRAALERILIKNWPNLKHCGLKSVKHSNSLTFKMYCEMTMEKLGVKIPLEDIDSEQTKQDLAQWRKVVVFYTCRLILAPLIESVILMDRLLYLKENNIDCKIIPVFDPLISPRNHILTAVKN